MKKNGKLIRNFILFLALIALTFYILLKDQSILQILEIIKSIKVEYILIAILCMGLYMICEAINIGRTLKALNEKSTFLKNLKYALIGFFFSSITPAASGGQPMQVYYMYKDKISVANSTLALLISLSSMQIITIGFALVSVIFNYQYLNNGLVIFFIIGITLNASALGLLIIGIFSRRMSKGLMNFAIKVLKFFRIKNIEKKQEKFENELVKYQYSAKYIKNNKKLILKTLLTTAIQFTIYYSITYWVYCALGFSQHNIFKIISMQSIVYATVSAIPSPGAVGVSEGAFMEIFRAVYDTTMIHSAVLLSRGVNFYLFVLLSGIVVIINQIRGKTNEIEEKMEEKTEEIIQEEMIETIKNVEEEKNELKKI
ncbi:MAG: flippase-like domain-containing protein [Clostridia bacterium]|nr:flippase-like domain-containing protein [Clostridia bacterium]